MTFKNALRYWSIHAVFCATPSFCLAYSIGYNRIQSVLGMILAIVSFIFLYAWLSSRAGFIETTKRFRLRSVIHVAASIRSFISGLGIVGLLAEGVILRGVDLSRAGNLSILYFPDLMAGILANALSAQILTNFGVHASVNRYSSNDTAGAAAFLFEYESSLLPTYLTTFIEGIILSGTLLVIVLFCFLLSRMYRFLKADKPT